jgi:hypothetical protein
MDFPFWLIPIIAVTIILPQAVNNQKKNGELSKEDKKRMIILVITGLLFLLFFVFVFNTIYSNKSTVPELENTANLNNENVEMYKDKVILSNPLENQEIKSPLVVEGMAVGNWFFEGDFPVILTNWDGLIIAEGIATAQGDWMTEEFVPFKAELEFEVDTSVSNRGSLILHKDNPSDIREYDDAFELPILFEE